MGTTTVPQMRKLGYRESLGPGLIVIRYQVTSKDLNPGSVAPGAKVTITHCTATLKAGPMESDKSGSK